MHIKLRRIKSSIKLEKKHKNDIVDLESNSPFRT